MDIINKYIINKLEDNIIEVIELEVKIREDYESMYNRRTERIFYDPNRSIEGKLTVDFYNYKKLISRINSKYQPIVLSCVKVIDQEISFIDFKIVTDCYNLKTSEIDFIASQIMVRERM